MYIIRIVIYIITDMDIMLCSQKQNSMLTFLKDLFILF